MGIVAVWWGYFVGVFSVLVCVLGGCLEVFVCFDLLLELLYLFFGGSWVFLCDMECFLEG